MSYLDNAVLEYIKNNQAGKPDSVDIVCHFRLRADITLAAVGRLQQAKKIERVYRGITAWYEYRYGLEATDEKAK